MEDRLDLELLRGAIDIHVHSSPSIFERHETEEIARHARDLGIRGLILKSHTHPTVDRAFYVSQRVKGIDIFHSVTLNYHVGGINPVAVDVALKMGAKCVWMPTIDSRRQMEVYGHIGGYGTQMHYSLPGFYKRIEPIFILNDRGELKPELHEIIDLVLKNNAILVAGHLTHPEIRALVRAAAKAGLKKMVIDHPHLSFVNLSLEQQKEMVKDGAILNYAYSEMSSKWWCISIKDFAEHIRQIGSQNIILSTDLGQLHNPLPAEGFRVLIKLLLEEGISAEDIRRMSHDNPARLVYDE